jgi:Mg-chelatase subunit ChlD
LYGRSTPLFEAMKESKRLFKNDAIKDHKKLLFIISDGLPNTGDPTFIANELKEMGVMIVACYVNANDSV